jgi:hypothetical protein
VPRLRFRFRPLLLLVPALLATVMLAACGSASPSSGGKGDDEKRLAFVDCLRDHGVDIQMSADGRRPMVRVQGRPGDGATKQTFGDGGPDDPNGPFAVCRKKTGWAPTPPTAAEQAQMRDRALRMARCMRSHGVDMPDPAPDGRMMLRIPGDSPTFQAAARACGMGVPGGGVPGGRGGRAGFAMGAG